MAEQTKVVWLPGWSVGSHVFREFLPALPEFRHDLADFSGCVRADDVVGVGEELICNDDGPVRIVAWSLGAMVACELASIYPGRIQALALCGVTDRFTTQYDEAGQYYEAGGWELEDLRQLSSALDERPAVLAAFYRQMFSPEEKRAGWARSWLQTNGESPQSVQSLRAGLDYLATFAARPAEITAPVHLLHGAEDQICPLVGAKRLAAGLAECDLTVLEGVGHVPFFSKSCEFGAWLAHSVRGE